MICFKFFSDDYNRVVLEPFEDIPDSDYINASYVDVSKSIIFYALCNSFILCV